MASIFNALVRSLGWLPESILSLVLAGGDDGVMDGCADRLPVVRMDAVQGPSDGIPAARQEASIASRWVAGIVHTAFAASLLGPTGSGVSCLSSELTTHRRTPWSVERATFNVAAALELWQRHRLNNTESEQHGPRLAGYPNWRPGSTSNEVCAPRQSPKRHKPLGRLSPLRRIRTVEHRYSPLPIAGRPSVRCQGNKRSFSGALAAYSSS